MRHPFSCQSVTSPPKPVAGRPDPRDQTRRRIGAAFRLQRAGREIKTEQNAGDVQPGLKREKYVGDLFSQGFVFVARILVFGLSDEFGKISIQRRGERPQPTPAAGAEQGVELLAVARREYPSVCRIRSD